ncbi:MAG: tetratricopeptide repeat protein, partial [Candidatus Rokuibacteriota bacterium]
IYQRVLELSPGDVRAEAALSTMPEAAPAPPPDKKAGKTPTPAGTGRPTPVADDAFINLGDMLREDEGPKDTRMVVAEEEPTGNEEADFQDMLKKFKQGVAENVEAEDYQSHYDLGVAFKEMGLIDEAIAEFQKALRGAEGRVRTYEAIGNCFMEKEQHAMAATILGRALNEKGQTDDQLVGVLYLLGRANEATGKVEEAMAFYQRVFVVDIQFQDVADRLSALENAAR